MNERAKFGAHPDAEVLNGFAEQALGSAEREQVLGHLAVCARCREIVTMTVESAEEERPVAGLPTRSAWFGGWRLAWVPAVALAALAALAVFVHVRPREEAREMATVESPAPPEAVGADEAARQAAAAPRIEARRAATAESNFSGEAPAESPAQLSSEEEPASRLETIAAADKIAEVAVPVPQVAIGEQSGAAQFAIESAGGAQPAESAAAPRMKVAMVPAVGMAAAPGAQPHVSTRRSVALPGGVEVVSSSASDKVTVAIAAAGEMYLSRDRGQHWEAVRQQWTGRAERVEFKVGVASARAFFEMTNDQSQVWTSTDGATWTPQ